MTKAIFFDVDGTLISFRTHQIPDSTKQALRELRARGIRVFVATGRQPGSLHFLKDLFDFEFDGYVAANGQYCYNREGVIYEHPFPRENLERILPYIEEHQIACDFVERDCHYVNLINEKVKYIFEVMGDSVRAPALDPKRALENKIYQMSIFAPEGSEEERGFFERCPGYRGVRWIETFADIIPEDGGKVAGIEQMIAHFGIRREETMVFGDGGNDLEMVAYGGIGVAMGNAKDALKEIADYVTSDVDEDGIYRTLEHFDIL